MEEEKKELSNNINVTSTEDRRSDFDTLGASYLIFFAAAYVAWTAEYNWGDTSYSGPALVSAIADISGAAAGTAFLFVTLLEVPGIMIFARRFAERLARKNEREKQEAVAAASKSSRKEGQADLIRHLQEIASSEQSDVLNVLLKKANIDVGSNGTSQ